VQFSSQVDYRFWITIVAIALIPYISLVISHYRSLKQLDRDLGSLRLSLASLSKQREEDRRSVDSDVAVFLDHVRMEIEKLKLELVTIKDNTESDLKELAEFVDGVDIRASKSLSIEHLNELASKRSVSHLRADLEVIEGDVVRLSALLHKQSSLSEAKSGRRRSSATHDENEVDELKAKLRNAERALVLLRGGDVDRPQPKIASQGEPRDAMMLEYDNLEKPVWLVKTGH
jgi:hypothetical protein